MLCILNTEEFDAAFTARLDEAEKKIFISDENARSNRHSVCARVLLGYMLYKEFGIKSFSYRYGESGKPYLKNENVFFSISHSGRYVLCCISEKEVGCDVEKIKDFNPRISKRFFTENEDEFLGNCGSRENSFTKLWTLKESILKKYGTGITGGLDTYCFADYWDKEMFSAYGCNFLSVNYGDYMVSVCTEGTDEKLQLVKKEDIVEYINNLY